MGYGRASLRDKLPLPSVALGPHAVTAALGNMYVSRAHGFSLLIATAGTFAAGENSGRSLLSELKLELTAARAMAVGSRPPPSNQNLKSLNGLSRVAVANALGKPSSCRAMSAHRCREQPSWTYIWGPDPVPPAVANDFVSVETGGPWLLVFRFNGSSVATVRWLGQR